MSLVLVLSFAKNLPIFRSADFKPQTFQFLKNWQLDIMATKTPKFFVLIVFWLYGISAFPWSINFWKHQNNLLINFFYALNQGLASVPVSKSENLSRDSCCFNAIVPQDASRVSPVPCHSRVKITLGILKFEINGLNY